MKLLHAAVPALLAALVPAAARAQVPLESKIGQMIMVTVTGDSVELHTPSMDTLRNDLAHGFVGGLVMLTWGGNLQSTGQIAHFTRELQKLSGTPLFLAIDQEGGNVARLSAANGFAATPSAYTLGTVLNSEPSTREAASTMAGWFVETGLNMNLAPVVDVNVNPASPAIGGKERSFSAHPDTVALHAASPAGNSGTTFLIPCHSRDGTSAVLSRPAPAVFPALAHNLGDLQAPLDREVIHNHFLHGGPASRLPPASAQVTPPKPSDCI